MFVSPRHPDYDRLARQHSGGTATAEAPEPTGEVLATFPRKGFAGKPDAELRVELTEYQGKPFLALKVFEQGRDGRWWPARGKGLSVRLGEAEGVAAAILDGLGRAGGPPEPRGRKGRPADHPRAVGGPEGETARADFDEF